MNTDHQIIFQKVLATYHQSAQPPLTLSTIVHTTIQLMSIVETCSTVLSGREKKELVLTILQTLLDQVADEIAVDTSDLQNTMDQMIRLTIPVLIDSMIVIDKGHRLITRGGTRQRLFSCC